MKVTPLAIPDVLLIEHQIFGDERGFFFESYNKRIWEEKTGLAREFVQNNHSKSTKGVLRGMHYQIEQPQGKLVRAIEGEIYDVVVDLRKSSPTFGRWLGVHLSEKNKYSLWVPEKFAHGFVVLSETAQFLYQTTDFYAPKHERCIRWNDPTLNINWPISGAPLLSEKDAKGDFFIDAEVYE